MLCCPHCCGLHAAGLATYMNLALTDPLQQQGLLAFDDTQLLAAGPTAAAALQISPLQPRRTDAEQPLQPSLESQQLADAGSTGRDTAPRMVMGQSLSGNGSSSDVLQGLQDGLLYVVAVSRNCSGKRDTARVVCTLHWKKFWALCSARASHHMCTSTVGHVASGLYK